MAAPVVAVCFVSGGGSPLYFKAFTGGADEAVRLQLAAYAALDVAEERERDPARDAKDPFLGTLMPVDDYKVFGYATSTHVRIIVVVRDVLLREDRVRELFRGLHRLYVDAACGPFSEPDARLVSPVFEEAVTRLCDAADVLYRGQIPL